MEETFDNISRHSPCHGGTMGGVSPVTCRKDNHRKTQSLDSETRCLNSGSNHNLTAPFFHATLRDPASCSSFRGPPPFRNPAMKPFPEHAPVQSYILPDGS